MNDLPEIGEKPAGSAASLSADHVWRADGGLTAEVQYAHILALRFKEPSSSAGSEEIQ